MSEIARPLAGTDRPMHETGGRHFSRNVYIRAAWALVALLTITLIDRVITWQTLGVHNGIGVQTSDIPGWIWLWSSVASLISPILGLVVAYGLLTFLKEQYDIHVAKWGWRVYVICICASILLLVLQPLQLWIRGYSPLHGQFSDPAILVSLYNVLEALGAIHVASGFVSDALLIGLVLLGISALRRSAEPVLTALMMMVGVIAVKRVLTDGIEFVMRYLIPREYAYSPNLISALNTFESGFGLFYMVMLTALLGLFFHMGRPDAVLAGEQG